MSQATSNSSLPQGPDEPTGAPGYRVNVWRRPWVQAVVPWVTSLSVHIGIIALALVLLASGAFQVLIEKVTQVQVNVPTTVLAENDIGGVPNVGAMDDITSQNAQLDPVEQSSNPLPEGEGDNLSALMSTGGSPAAADSITGITGTGSLAEALGGGGGEGSTLFGEAGGGGQFMGFDIGREGDGGEVYRVVFVCDASGSMDGWAKALLVNELKKAIDPLKPIQFYNMLFFRGNQFSAAFPDRLEPANPRNKQVTYAFLDNLSVGGSTNPVPALEAAFAMEPELVFLLTDGQFDQLVGYDEVKSTIARLNANKKAMVNTIQFMNRDETAEGVLRAIAFENGGEYKFVDEDDL